MFTHSLFFTVQACSHPPATSSPPPPQSPFFLCWCDADEGRSWSGSNPPVLPSMLLLRVSGAELQHRPPLSTFSGHSFMQQRERAGISSNTHELSEACVCVCLLTQTPLGSEKTHLLRSFADSLCAAVCVCFASGTMHTHTPLFTVNKDGFHFTNKLMFI